MDFNKDSNLITSAEYRQRLSKMRNNVYLHGQRSSRNNAEFEGGIETFALFYDLARDPQWAEMLTATSSISGKKINRFCHILQSPEDMINKIKVTRLFTNYAGHCIQRCMGADALNGFSVATYLTDKKFGTEYYRRFLNYLEYFQKNDLTAACAMTDVKGHRGLRPGEQPDPDMYLHIVERKSNGIVVRGAKVSNSSAPTVDEILVTPTRQMGPDEKDWAVGFAIPADWEGVKLIASCQGGRGLATNKLDCPSDKYGYADSLTIFDNVFVPWDRVFLCGETECSAQLTSGFARCHRQSYCGCKPALVDIMLGAASLIAKYNGVPKVQHIREKLTDLAVDAALIYASGIASAVNGEKYENGTFLPDELYSNVGRYLASRNVTNWLHILVDIAGGLAENVVAEDHYLSDELHPYFEKYYAADPQFKTEHRYRLLRYIRGIAHGQIAEMSPGGDIHGGGAPEMCRLAIWRETDIEYCEDLIKRIVGIGNADFIPPGKGKL
jgi:aromatic ring hydroxylase